MYAGETNSAYSRNLKIQMIVKETAHSALLKMASTPYCEDIKYGVPVTLYELEDSDWDWMMGLAVKFDWSETDRLDCDYNLWRKGDLWKTSEREFKDFAKSLDGALGVDEVLSVYCPYSYLKHFVEEIGYRRRYKTKRLIEDEWYGLPNRGMCFALNDVYGSLLQYQTFQFYGKIALDKWQHKLEAARPDTFFKVLVED